MVQHNLNTYINYKRGWDEQVELTVLGRSDVDESTWADWERNRKARRMPGVNGVGELIFLGTKWKNDHNGPGMGDWSSYDLVPTSRPASIVLYGVVPLHMAFSSYMASAADSPSPSHFTY